jgi:hypothetical protein
METSVVDSTILDAARSTSWWAVPEAIANVRDAGGVFGGMEFWNQVAMAVGRPEHALRQMFSAYDFVRWHSRGLGKELTALALARPYTHLEVIHRIAEVDPDQAFRLIAQPGSAPTVRALRERLREARENVGDPSALVEGQKSRAAALTLVAQRMPAAIASSASGGIRFHKWPGTTATVSPSLVAVWRDRESVNRTVGVLVIPKSDRDTTLRGIARAGWESTFFDTYWLAVAPNMAAEVETWSCRFGLGNVGVAAVDVARAALEVASKPQALAPVPDRRRFLRLPDRYHR